MTGNGQKNCLSGSSAAVDRSVTKILLLILWIIGLKVYQNTHGKTIYIAYSMKYFRYIV